MPLSEADAAGGVTTERTELSKRQRRKQLATSTKNVTPQQPKLDNAEARAKAQLRVAGVTVMPTTVLDVNDPGIRFGRLLGSTDQRQRHKAVLQLKAYLQARCAMDQVGLSELDLLKLWKGLWYTLYMADKTAVQDELSKNLVDLLWSVAGTEEEDMFAAESYLEATKEDDDDEDDNEEVNEDDNDGVIMQEIENTLDTNNHDEDPMDEESKSKDDNNNEDNSVEDDSVPNNMIPHCRGAHLASLFVKTFFATIRREWGTMDKYRVDKFYTLIRLMMAQVYTYMARRQWHMGILRLFNDALYEEILSVTPNGLRCHVIDLTMEELCKANSQASMPLTEAIFCCVLEPYFAMVQGVEDKIVQQRIVDNILLKFLMEYSVVSDTTEQENTHILDQVHVGTVADFIFDLGSDKTTKGEYRKILYSTHKVFKKQMKKIGVDVDIGQQHDHHQSHHHEHHHNHQDNTDGSEDEVPELQLLEDAGIEDEVQDKKEEVVTTELKPKKSKKKRKVENNVVLQEEMDKSIEEPPKKKKKKSKKKKLDSTVSTESCEEMVEVKPVTISKKEKNDSIECIQEKKEDEIVISVEDQKKAKKLAKREKAAAAAAAATTPTSEGKAAKTVTTKKSKKEKEEEAESRRVSFGQVNHSKSHKASMRDLKNASPKPVPMTPDKSILRVKTPNSKDAARVISKKSKRKKPVE